MKALTAAAFVAAVLMICVGALAVSSARVTRERCATAQSQRDADPAREPLPAPTPMGAPQPNRDAEIATASIEDLSRWISNYYRSPDPETIPARVRRMSHLGMFTNRRPEAFHFFLGLIMRSHPDKIAAWMEACQDLPEVDRVVLHHAIWVSQTDQGREWLASQGLKGLAEREGHPLMTGDAVALEPHHVDMLWEWFFATGDKAPVRRIVGFFNMLSADPGEADLPPKPVPGGDRPTFLRQSIGGVAVWSASSLASRHDKLLEILKETQKDPMLPARGGAWLKRVIDIAERDRKQRREPRDD